MTEQENTPKTEVQDNSSSINEIVQNMISLNGHDIFTISKILKSKDPIDQEISLEYLRHFNFTDNSLLEAYRKLCKTINISGDHQIISLINRRFAQIYHEQNSKEFSLEEIYFLVTSFLMLNTDRHNKNVRSKMTSTEFIKSVNTGNFNFDENYLNAVFKSIKNRQLIGIESVNTKKRSSETNIVVPVENKKVKTERNLNFDYHFLKMKHTTKLFESSWKLYFCTLNNLELALYNRDEFSQFSNSNIEPKSFSNLNDFSRPVKEIKIHHAYAVVCSSNYRKCELVLIDNTKYYFKFHERAHAEHWAHCVNLAASILSKLPFLAYQRGDTRTIAQYTWSTEITPCEIDEQKNKIEELKKQFEQDVAYLNSIRDNRKIDKEKIKTSEKNVFRFSLYHRTLNTVTNEIYQSLLTNGSKNICSQRNVEFDTTEPSTSSNIDRTLFSSPRQHPTDISNIIQNTDTTEDI